MPSDTIKTFRIAEPDLQKLESALPRLCEHMGEANNRAEVQVLFGEVKQILSDVRWEYGPPMKVEIVRGGE